MTMTARAQVMMLGSRRNMDPSIFDPPTRPEHIKDKKGYEGNRISILTNYFKLGAAQAWRLYQYR